MGTEKVVSNIVTNGIKSSSSTEKIYPLVTEAALFPISITAAFNSMQGTSIGDRISTFAWGCEFVGSAYTIYQFAPTIEEFSLIYP